MATCDNRRIVAIGSDVPTLWSFFTLKATSCAPQATPAELASQPVRTYRRSPDYLKLTLLALALLFFLLLVVALLRRPAANGLAYPGPYAGAYPYTPGMY